MPRIRHTVLVVGMGNNTSQGVGAKLITYPSAPGRRSSDRAGPQAEDPRPKGLLPPKGRVARVTVAGADPLTFEQMAEGFQGTGLAMTSTQPVTHAEVVDDVVRHRPHLLILCSPLPSMAGLGASLSEIRRSSPHTAVLLAADLAEDPALSSKTRGEPSSRKGQDGITPGQLEQVLQLVRRLADAPHRSIGLSTARTHARHQGPDDLDAIGPQTVTLTPRERDVLVLIHKGASVKMIAAELGISPGTARNHIHRILGKTGARSQIELVALIHRRRIVLG